MRYRGFPESTRRIRGLAIVVLAGFILAGCAQTHLGIHVLKNMTQGAGPADVGAGGYYKVGKPYQIKGIWYYPKEDPDYDETGIASWYGDPFHGRKTANGETYDMNALTAAHKTLPMPVNVRVTNLENGRSLVLRVNDRGPFVSGRIIDVSRRAAQLLGFQQQGIAKVRVQIIDGKRNESFISEKPVTPETERNLATAAPVSDVSAAPLDFGGPVAPAPVITPAPEPVVQMAAIDPLVDLVPVPAQQDIYVQAGAFGDPDNAERMKDRLGVVGNVTTSVTTVNGRTFHRVRIGPLSSVDEADQALDRVHSMNISGARIIID